MSNFSTEQKVLPTLRDDVRRGDFWRSLRREYAELKEVLLDEQRQQKLSAMGAWRRWLVTMYWILKALFFKLTPTRRILLVIGMVLSFVSQRVVITGDDVVVTSDWSGLGVMLILFVLALELKDKLVARKELEAGREIHRALMPEQSPRIPGWDIWLYERPAREIGGDLVDFISFGGKEAGVVLADISGKGLRAALLSAKLQASLRAIVPEASSLQEVGDRLNKIFYRDTPHGVFASVVYFRLAEASGNVSVLNAGHMPPVLITQQKQEVLPKGNVAFGLHEAATFEEHEFTLGDGDVFIAYSDGLTEARNSLGEFLGEERLLSTLKKGRGMSAQQFGETIVGVVEQFVGEALQHDDISLTIIRRVSSQK